MKPAVNLTDEDVQFLMNNTSYSEKEIRDWYKGFQVDCPDGKLSRDKFIEIYKVFFKGGNPEKFCQHVYRTFDEDGNGWIDFKEFLMAIGITTSTNPREKLKVSVRCVALMKALTFDISNKSPKIKLAFNIYDVDNNGFISRSEMLEIFNVIAT